MSLQICKINEIYRDLVQQFSKKCIMPVIGSGFSGHCCSRSGFVPTGTEMKAHMIRSISQSIGKTEDDPYMEELHSYKFPELARIYNKKLPVAARKDYIRQNFLDVDLDRSKSEFLSIDWPYIYTLNIDDAIEKNSQYKTVIGAYTNLDFDSLTETKAVIKLHGDAQTFLLSKDEPIIFDYGQYAKSIMKNQVLLNMLRLDFSQQNMLFIGCALDSELDLATIGDYTTDLQMITNKYIFFEQKPSDFQLIALEDYGITHVVIVNSYSDIYEFTISAYKEAMRVKKDDLNNYCNPSIKMLTHHIESSHPYFFYGKHIFNNKTQELEIPHFFVRRNYSNVIIELLASYSIVIMHGARISGKSYILADIAISIKNRSIYFFDSRVNFNDSAVKSLLEKDGALLLFDSNALKKDQIDTILSLRDVVSKRSINIIIVINNSDKDIIDFLNGKELGDSIRFLDINSKFLPEERNDLNTKLSRCNIANFDSRGNMLDNLITVARSMKKRGSFDKTKLCFDDARHVACLILLAVYEKLYTSDLVLFNIAREMYKQISIASPLLSEESVLSFELGRLNSSRQKVTMNAKYWLYDELGRFSSSFENYQIIIEAYQIIVRSLKTAYPNKRVFQMDRYKDVIMFDVINEIFAKQDKGQLRLIIKIYDALNDLLSDEPSYFHQKAKCYLWYSNSTQIGSLDALNKAYQFALLAKRNFEILYQEKFNEKVFMSLSHVSFTLAIISCKLCLHDNCSELIKVYDALNNIEEALSSPHNNQKLVREADLRESDILKLINRCMVGEISGQLNLDNKRKVAELFYKIQTARNLVH